MEHTDVCFAPVLTMAEAAEHPHNVARQMIIERDGVKQPAPAPGSAARRRRSPARRSTPARAPATRWRTGASPRTASTPSSRTAPSSPADHARTRSSGERPGTAHRSPSPERPRRLAFGDLMATIVFVHAHPDDEASTTAGSMARAAAEGHRVVLVVCTNGEHGEVPEDLAAGETLVDRRRAEVSRSAAGARRGPRRVARLPGLRHDRAGRRTTTPARSGGPTSTRPPSGWPPSCDEEQADVVVVYDWHGGYGHPDHIQVHRVGHRAADLAGTPKRFEVTYNRDLVTAMMSEDPDTPRGLRPQRPVRRRQPVRHGRGRPQPGRRRQRLHGAQAPGPHRPRQPGHRHRHVPRHARGGVRALLRHRVLPRARRAGRACAPAGSSRASDGHRPPRPPRSGHRRLGRRSRPRPRRRRRRRRRRAWPIAWRRSARPRRSSPARCGAAGRRPSRWPRGGRVAPTVDPLVAEIPSPPGVPMGERVRLAAGGDGRARGRRSARGTRRTATASPAASPPSTSTPSWCRTSSPSTP